MVAGPLSPSSPSVVLVSDALPIWTTAVALAVNVCATALLIVTVHVAVLPPLLSVGLPQVLI